MRHTKATLEEIAVRIREVAKPIPANGADDDPTGLRNLARELQRQGIHGSHAIWFVNEHLREEYNESPREQYTEPQNGSNEPINAADGWDRPVCYRCPGPVHKRGWDLWSCGPNGVDEQGGGDDILVGEDVAVVGSAR
jgi:hypothetical protein